MTTVKVLGFIVGVVVVQTWRIARVALRRPIATAFVVLGIVFYIAS